MGMFDIVSPYQIHGGMCPPRISAHAEWHRILKTQATLRGGGVSGVNIPQSSLHLQRGTVSWRWVGDRKVINQKEHKVGAAKQTQSGVLMLIRLLPGLEQ